MLEVLVSLQAVTDESTPGTIRFIAQCSDDLLRSPVKDIIEKSWNAGAPVTVSLVSRPASIWQDASGLTAMMLAAACSDGPCTASGMAGSYAGCSASCAILQELLVSYPPELNLLLKVVDNQFNSVCSVPAGVNLGLLAVRTRKCDGCIRKLLERMWQEALPVDSFAESMASNGARESTRAEFAASQDYLPHFRVIWLAAKSHGLENVARRLEQLVGDTVRPGVALLRVWSPRAGDSKNFGIYDGGVSGSVGHASLMYCLPGESSGPNAQIRYVSHWPGGQRDDLDTQTAKAQVLPTGGAFIVPLALRTVPNVRHSIVVLARY